MEAILISFEVAFGCWHRNLSRPFTLSGWAYEVCLNCGKKFAYDLLETGPWRRIDAGPSNHANQIDRSMNKVHHMAVTSVTFQIALVSAQENC